MNYAKFAADESDARSFIEVWIATTRGDWTISPVVEVFRDPEIEAEFGPWNEGCVAPCYRDAVGGRKLRMLKVTANGPFARDSGSHQGYAEAVFRVCFPA